MFTYKTFRRSIYLLFLSVLAVIFLAGFADRTHAVTDGFPREQYPRTYVLMPPNADVNWVEATLRATWDAHRYTVGGSADDAGIGDLRRKRVIALNPSAWSEGNLAQWFGQNYYGVDYVPVNAANANQVSAVLQNLSLGEIPVAPIPRYRVSTSQPQYERTYILFPPGTKYNAEWAVAAARGTWNSSRMTIGGSADDAGIGQLTNRRVIAINPQDWPDGNLAGWYATHYPGATYQPVTASSPYDLQLKLQLLP